MTNEQLAGYRRLAEGLERKNGANKAIYNAITELCNELEQAQAELERVRGELAGDKPQPPQVDWGDSPAFALWWAVDEDGESTWFQCMPVLAKDDKGGYWDNPMQAATRRYARYDLGGFDWQQTLQGRPGVIDMRAAAIGIDAQY